MPSVNIPDSIVNHCTTSDGDVSDVPLTFVFDTSDATTADIVEAAVKSWTIREQAILKGTLKNVEPNSEIRVNVVGLFAKQARTNVQKAQTIMAKLTDAERDALIEREIARRAEAAA